MDLDELSSQKLVKYDKQVFNQNPYSSLLESVYSLIDDGNCQANEGQEPIVNQNFQLVHQAKLLEIADKLKNMEAEYNDNSQLRHFQQFHQITLVKSGGFGIVFRAVHRLDNQVYALKLIPLRILLTSNLQTFLLSKIREIRYLAKLNHPNIVRYYNSWIDLNKTENIYHYFSLHNVDLYNCSYELSQTSQDSRSTDEEEYGHDGLMDWQEHEDKIEDQNDEIDKETEILNVTEKDLVVTCPTENYKYIYLSIQMEYIPNTLKTWIKTQPSLLELYEVLSGLLLGLEYLHQYTPPIIHCDLKPDNILVGKTQNDKWIAKLADFGLVTQLNSIWRPSSGEGTSLYKAPELEVMNPTPAADIYSLGLVLYEINLKYQTEMERYDLLLKFRNGTTKTNTLLDMMVAENPDLRPNIGEVREYLKKMTISLASKVSKVSKVS